MLFLPRREVATSVREAVNFLELVFVDNCTGVYCYLDLLGSLDWIDLRDPTISYSAVKERLCFCRHQGSL